MKDSIKKNSDFKKIYSEKKSFATKNLVLFISKNSDMESNRLGISVSHKVGNSVVRHTLSRRMREIFREYKDQIEKGTDIIAVLRVGSYETKFFKLKEDFIKLCKKHGIVKKETFD